MHVEFNESLTLFKWFDIQTWLFLFGIRLFCLNYACENVSVKVSFCINVNKDGYFYIINIIYTIHIQ